MLQANGPIAFARKSRTETESRYSNIERESWASCLVLSDSTSTSMDGMWKCIRTINRLSPSTPNVPSLPTQVVAYAAPHTTVQCEHQVCSWLLCQTGRCTRQGEPACNTGPIRGLDLSVHEVHMHVKASPTRIVENSHGNIKDSTLHMISYHSAGQSTERIAQRT